MVGSTGYFDSMIIVNNVYNDLLVFMKILGSIWLELDYINRIIVENRYSYKISSSYSWTISFWWFQSSPTSLQKLYVSS